MPEPKQQPAHGSLVYKARQQPERLVVLPPWTGWQPSASEATRAKRFLRRHVVVPTGTGAAQGFRVAPFQSKIIDTLYDHLATFCALPTSNGKTSLLAGLALERLTRGDSYAEVAVVSTRQETAGLLVEAAMRMVECSPELARRCRWHSRDQVLEYTPTGSKMHAHPAKLTAVQGLNYNLCILDEFGFVQDELLHSMLARIGKREDARLVGIGTPGFVPNAMFRMRELWKEGELPPGVAYLEWAADESADVMDRRAWRKANPAIAAGFLHEAALEVQARLLPEREFRTYHMALWCDQSVPWLPVGAWSACPFQPPPPDGSEVVLAVEGTFRRTMAVVGATMDGAIFFGWAAEAATDADLRRVIETAAEQFDVRAVVYPKRIRPKLFEELREAGVAVETWDGSPDNEATSANEFYRAIVGDEGRLAHDHHELLSQHMATVKARYATDGSLRLTKPDDGRFADAAIAARNAWWVAARVADGGSSYTIF